MWERIGRKISGGVSGRWTMFVRGSNIGERNMARNTGEEAERMARWHENGVFSASMVTSVNVESERRWVRMVEGR